MASLREVSFSNDPHTTKTANLTLKSKKIAGFE